MFAVTAVEDKLQDEVPRCIKDFKDAGIKVWMVTGDKDTTAKMIAIQCGLLNPTVQLIRLKEQLNLERIKNDIQESLIESAKYEHFELMVDGLTITLLSHNFFFFPEVAELLLNADSVILYRASPSQKAELVKLLKTITKTKMICAVGDSANDVQMI